MERQMKLFETPFRSSSYSYYVEIVQEDGSIYVICLSGRKIFSLSQAKKVAAITYNRQRDYCDEAFVKFGKVEKRIKGKR